VVKRLVQLGPEVEKEFELDLAKLKPKGTVLIPFFADYGLPRPAGAPRRVRRDLPDRYICFEPVTLGMLASADELTNLEDVVSNAYRVLEAALANRGRAYYAGARLIWREMKALRLTPGNLVRLGMDRLRRRKPDFRKYSGKVIVQIQLDVLVGTPLLVN